MIQYKSSAGHAKPPNDDRGSCTPPAVRPVCRGDGALIPPTTFGQLPVEILAEQVRSRFVAELYATRSGGFSVDSPIRGEDDRALSQPGREGCRCRRRWGVGTVIAGWWGGDDRGPCRKRRGPRECLPGL